MTPDSEKTRFTFTLDPQLAGALGLGGEVLPGMTGQRLTMAWGSQQADGVIEQVIINAVGDVLLTLVIDAPLGDTPLRSRQPYSVVPDDEQ